MLFRQESSQVTFARADATDHTDHWHRQAALCHDVLLTLSRRQNKGMRKSGGNRPRNGRGNWFRSSGKPSSPEGSLNQHPYDELPRPVSQGKNGKQGGRGEGSVADAACVGGIAHHFRDNKKMVTYFITGFSAGGLERSIAFRKDSRPLRSRPSE